MTQSPSPWTLLATYTMLPAATTLEVRLTPSLTPEPALTRQIKLPGGRRRTAAVAGALPHAATPEDPAAAMARPDNICRLLICQDGSMRSRRDLWGRGELRLGGDFGGGAQGEGHGGQFLLGNRRTLGDDHPGLIVGR